MFGIFKKMRSGLSKTARGLWAFLGHKPLDEATLESLEEAFYSADFGVEATEAMMSAIRQAYKENKDLKGQDAATIGSHVLEKLLIGAEGQLTIGQHQPEVICLVGINGAGKTTCAAKLAHYFNQSGKKVILGACDTFRAAANEQIQIWANRLNIDLVSSQHGADSAAVAFDTYTAAKSRGADIVLLDTAGRLHTKSHLMEELKKLKRVLSKHDAQAPHHVWMVLDGSLGANSIQQAQVFHEALGLTGLLMTKLDGTSRGGALVGIYQALKIPIYYIGLGEAPEDLQPFIVSDYLKSIFQDLSVDN